MRWSVPALWWLVWSALGVAVIALPDSGPRLVSISAAHGPSLQDTLGIVALLAGAGAPWWFIWRGRGRLADTTGGTQVALAFTAGLGLGLLLASVAADFGAWWAIGAGLLAAVQAGVFVGVARPDRSTPATDNVSG
ncbi:MAG: hypothetical protein GEV03_23115 [Streptosporangiales bacterium]|nr:hypothetical protein [Streptosporangiales bacterium]